MKKSLSLIAIVAMLAVTGCGSSEGGTSNTGSSAEADVNQIPDLRGEWQQVDSEGEDTFMFATIDDDTIYVDWVFLDDPDLALFDDDNDGVVSAIYWEGSYEAPTEADSSHSWVSAGNTDVMGSALFSSTDDSKEFSFDDGLLSFDVTFQGDTATVEMEQVTEADVSDASDDETEQLPEDVTALPFNANEMLMGDATPEFDDGEPGEMSVVQIGDLNRDNGTVLFAFRNNTPDMVGDIEWTVVARANGDIVGSGTSFETVPAVVEPGAVGLSYVFFDSAEGMPESVEYDFEAAGVLSKLSLNRGDLKVTEANKVGGAIVASAVNETGAIFGGSPNLHVYCFDGDTLVAHTESFADQDGPTEDGESVTFSTDLYMESCPTFIAGAQTWFE